MEKLSESVRCIAPCLRGCGYSSYNKNVTSLKGFAEDIMLLMHEVIKSEKYFIVGHSLGGGVAM